MFNEYWWILPLFTFVVPIIYWWILKKIKEMEPPEYDGEYDSALDRDFRPTAVFLVGWITTGGFLIGHYI